MKIRPTLAVALALFLGLTALATPGLAAPPEHEEMAPAADEDTPLATRAAAVLEDQLAEASNRRVPRNLRENALCVGVFPSVVKAGFIVAAKRGHGLVSCRHGETGAWGAPAVFTVSAASVGLQAGIQSASVVLLFMNEEAVERIATGERKLAVGVDLDVTAGPVGGTATVDTQPAILSYVRTKGLFAGLNLEGARMGFAPKINAEHYGAELSARDILLGGHAAPAALAVFQETLAKYAAGTEPAPAAAPAP
ncbi:MAG: lipid-binding SYLF domain-containing protein [Acidobacteriota bacterium]|nr:lipid-binding SYLF domain-containing protein [Acidobacteriota bacterium]MDH3523776.1 lipid-binding SYLF domain-containing protein [Acidobacteriota bacterium]